MIDNTPHTPSNACLSSLRAAYVVQVVKDAYRTLERESDLSPNNPKINDVLGKLVRTLSDGYTPEEEKAILGNKSIKAIQKPLHALLSKAEGAMEDYWEKKLSEKPEITEDDMKGFWYWQNYRDLVCGEATHVPQVPYKDNESICFVGAGPLPMTAIFLHQQTGRKVTCVDNDPAACACAADFIKKAGFGDCIDVVCEDGAVHDYNRHPMTIIASLVPHKEAVFRRISETCDHDVCFGVRSAERLHTILYPPVEENRDELRQCEHTGKTDYNPAVINTTLFYRSSPGWHKNLDRVNDAPRPAAASGIGAPHLH